MKNLKIYIILALVFIGGFIFGVEYKAYQIRQIFYNGLSELSDSLSEDREIEPEESVIINKVVGDEVELATMKLKVNEVLEQSTISSKYGSPKIASTGAKFVVLNIDITNLSKNPFMFWSDGIVIEDDKGRTFNPYDSVISNIDNYIDARELAPGVTQNGFMVYEIAADSEKYSLGIYKGGTNEYYKILLK